MPKLKLKIPPERQAEYDWLVKEVEAQERAGQFNTVHHEVLRNLQAAFTTPIKPTPPPENKE